jgi:hypothetical protein
MICRPYILQRKRKAVDGLLMACLDVHVFTSIYMYWVGWGGIYMDWKVIHGYPNKVWRHSRSLELISYGIVFFSHNKSANGTFQPDFSVKRTGLKKTIYDHVGLQAAVGYPYSWLDIGLYGVEGEKKWTYVSFSCTNPTPQATVLWTFSYDGKWFHS